MKVGDERLTEMLAAADKATPGPWGNSRKLGVGPRSDADDQSYGFVIPVAEPVGDNKENDARHIANCDPQTIRAIITELVELRKAVKPFAAGSMDVSGRAVIGVTRDDLDRLKALTEPTHD